MRIRPVWSESSLYAWRRLGSLAIHWAHREDSDQTGRMPRLIWVFAGRTVILLVLSWGGLFVSSLCCYHEYTRKSVLVTLLKVVVNTTLLNRYGEKVKKDSNVETFEPAHKIMVHFVLRKLILQTRMRSHLEGLDVWFLVGPFANFLTLCVRTAKALVRLHGCAGSPEPSLVAYAISTIISWAGSFVGKSLESVNDQPLLAYEDQVRAHLSS